MPRALIQITHGFLDNDGNNQTVTFNPGDDLSDLDEDTLNQLDEAEAVDWSDPSDDDADGDGVPDELDIDSGGVPVPKPEGWGTDQRPTEPSATNPRPFAPDPRPAGPGFGNEIPLDEAEESAVGNFSGDHTTEDPDASTAGR
jgi:hypothetical protein